MSTAAGPDGPRIQSVEVDDEVISARLVDGRVISVPLTWSWRLTKASPNQRRRYELIGGGEGIHWPDVDEDISVEGMLSGRPTVR
jgi:uncharacterized protein DUF2442